MPDGIWAELRARWVNGLSKRDVLITAAAKSSPEKEGQVGGLQEIVTVFGLNGHQMATSHMMQTLESKKYLTR